MAQQETFLVEIRNLQGQVVFFNDAPQTAIGSMVATGIQRGNGSKFAFDTAVGQLNAQSIAHIKRHARNFSTSPAGSPFSVEFTTYQVHHLVVHWFGSPTDTTVDHENWTGIWDMINKRGGVDTLKMYIDMVCKAPNNLGGVTKGI